eukprot:TRINITY_DN105957_c0_g1_i1.p1 TRINITY_DN105957_c0_g1~~TRINITY_DN105957_c0_g1_i1.p1  ORF type:complete len:335 (-),score=66.91 TRINITY_DN105957_c0_g1_i1:21-1025(-)
MMTLVKSAENADLTAVASSLSPGSRGKIHAALDGLCSEDPGLAPGSVTVQAARAAYRPLRVLDYPAACQYMYWSLDNVDGAVEGIYTGKLQSVQQSRQTEVIVSADGKHVDVKLLVEQNGELTEVVNDGGKGYDCDAMDEAYQGKLGVNCEHVWPQGWLRKSGAIEGISNLHHMLPADVRANKYRGDNAFGEVDDLKALWVKADRSSAKVQEEEPGTAAEFDKKKRIFEPREVSKGNIARAMFYMAAIYGEELFGGYEEAEACKAWWQLQKDTLRAWNLSDPPDASEIDRTRLIGKVQGRVNPFALHPDWIEEVFFSPEIEKSSSDSDIPCRNA